MNSAELFETIVRDHYEPLYRFAMSLTREESDAQDLTQHTFEVWAQKGHQLRDLSRARTWLHTTLYRAFLHTRRRNGRFPQQDFDEAIEKLPAVPPAFGDRLDSLQVLPALAKVDEIYQAALALCYLEDCTYSDIAGILDVPVGTVKSRIARGLAQLREILLPDEFPGSTPPNADGRNGTLVPVPCWNQAAPWDSHLRHSHV